MAEPSPPVRLPEPVRLPDGREVRGRPLLPDSWRPLAAGRCELLATRCPRCAALTFPAAQICPRCWNRDALTAEAVPEPGTVYAISTVRTSEPGIEAPYRIGYADFAGGLRICGRFTGPEVDVNEAVDVVVAVLREEPEAPLLGWAFRKAAFPEPAIPEAALPETGA